MTKQSYTGVAKKKESLIELSFVQI